MGVRDTQAIVAPTHAERAVVEEGEQARVVVDHVRRHVARDDAAEEAAHRSSRSARSSIAKRRSVRCSESRMARRTNTASTIALPR